MLSGLADEVDFGVGGAGEDDEQNAGELGGRGLLVQPEEHPDGVLEGHQGPGRGVRHLAQREPFERERQDGEQNGQPGGGREDAEGEVTAGLRECLRSRQQWGR